MIASPYDWPAVNAAKAIVRNEPVEGTWFNRTEEYEARRRGEKPEKYDYATKYRIELLVWARRLRISSRCLTGWRRRHRRTRRACSE